MSYAQPTKPITVRVYRNLKHGRNSRPLYSVMHKGHVIARSHRVLLTGASFIIRESGRQRVLAEGRKNVHAFVKGTLTDDNGAFGIDADGKDLPVQVTYNPFNGAYFQTREWHKVTGARAVLLNERGMTACYLEYLED